MIVIQNCFVLFVVSILLASGALADFKDLLDPVVNKSVTYFANRLPGFVYKHGTSVFVSDESLTRGNFLLALYEYDKSLYISKMSITQQEFNQLISRVTALEKISIVGQQTQSKLDIYTIINELQPNLPTMLDGSLTESKLFTNFRDEVLGRVDKLDERILKVEKEKISPIQQVQETGNVVHRNELLTKVSIGLSMAAVFFVAR